MAHLLRARARDAVRIEVVMIEDHAGIEIARGSTLFDAVSEHLLQSPEAAPPVGVAKLGKGSNFTEREISAKSAEHVIACIRRTLSQAAECEMLPYISYISELMPEGGFAPGSPPRQLPTIFLYLA